MREPVLIETEGMHDEDRHPIVPFLASAVLLSAESSFCRLRSPELDSLSALRGIVRHAGGRLEISGVDQVDPPIEALNARQQGRLIRAVDQHRWRSMSAVKRIAASGTSTSSGSLRLGTALRDV